MVGSSAASRWHRLRELLRIRHGPGAAILPPSVTRIHMEFARTMNEGHMGPKKFWRDMLPRLKYHNPAIPMIVNRNNANDGPATMTIYFQTANNSNPSSEPITRVQPPSSGIDTSKAAEPAADEKVVKIDMKGLRSEAILEAFMVQTSAEPISPTPEEAAEIEEVEEMNRQGELDRQVQKRKIELRRKEKEMLAKARETPSGP